MTLQDWTPIYARLCGALSRKETPAQMRAYFDALSGFPAGVVSEAATIASSRTWPPTHPHAGELVEIAHGLRRARHAPAAMCDRCHGVLFLVTECAGWKAGGPGQPPEPVDRQQLCRRDFPHATHEDAHPCPQCHPLAMKGAAA